MSETQTLERAYRRILSCYPRSFRAASEDEILAVLLAIGLVSVVLIFTPAAGRYYRPELAQP